MILARSQPFRKEPFFNLAFSLAAFMALDIAKSFFRGLVGVGALTRFEAVLGALDGEDSTVPESR